MDDVNKATGKTFPEDKKQFTLAFSSLTHYCFPKILFIFYAKRRLEVDFSILFRIWRLVLFRIRDVSSTTVGD